jgi:hypothetical protein
MTMKNFSNNIGHRNRNLPAWSAVPEPTSPLRVPLQYMSICKMKIQLN